MNLIITKISAIGLLALTSVSFAACSSSRVEDLSNISKFHKATLNSAPASLASNSSGEGGSCVDLYIDYSDCMTTANKSDYYRGVQPAIIACNPNYYSIKGDKIQFETNDKGKVHQLLNNITNVDYSAIKAAVDSIVSKDHEAILITDGEYYQKGIGANLNNPYLADEFKTWLNKGHDIYVYSEPYQSGKFMKNRYYMLFTDHRLPNNIQEIFSRNAPADNNVKMVHLYSGIPSIDVPQNGVEFNDLALITKDAEINPALGYESHTMDASWDDIYSYILNATDDNGNQIKGGDFFLKGLRLNVAENDAYMPEELELKCYEISDLYTGLSPKSTKVELPDELEEVFVLDDKAWKKGNIVVKIDPEFNGTTLNGAEGNLIRIDIRVKKSKDNFSNNDSIGGNFKFDSPYGFNTSIYESLKQTLNDPTISPENSGDPVIYTIYLSSYTK